MNYYNEIEPNAAAWLRELIRGGHIADGTVDERSIKDVTPKDLKGFDQCHFFAGIGVWSYALAQAGWPKDRQVWTGSCPCQPFSVAGQGARTTDPRHLWPAWFGLIQKCRPDTIFGEQVATEAGRVWLDIVGDNLEREGYAVGACSTNAVYFGAPHRRQRTYFVGHADRRRPMELSQGSGRADGDAGARVQEEALADAVGERLEGAEFLGNRNGVGKQRRDRRVAAKGRSKGRQGAVAGSFDPKRPWDPCEWLDFENPWTKETCQRGVEPGTLPLAARTPSDVVRIRGYGNALCAPQAIGFVEAFLGVRMMVRTHSQTQGAKHYAGRGLEETIVQELEDMLEATGLDGRFEVVGKQRGRKNREMLFHAPPLPGATEKMPLRPDFGIRDRRTGQFAAFGGAKKSLRERGLQDLVIAQRIKEMHPGTYWFECTNRESASATSAQINRKLKTVSAIFGSAWDAFCSTAAPDSVIDMKKGLTRHLREWRPTLLEAAE